MSPAASSLFEDRRWLEARPLLRWIYAEEGARAGFAPAETGFPVWALAVQALAACDERAKLASALPALRAVVLERRAQGPAWSGFALALVEAQLECGTTADDDLLCDLDPTDCLPLTSQTASLWKRWLIAERTWLQSLDAAASEQLWSEQDGANGATAPATDPLSEAEERRIRRLAALLMTRIAIARRDAAQAQQWLDAARQFDPLHWETDFVAGVLACLRSDMPAARACMEASLAENPFQSRVRFELGLLADRLGETADGAIPDVHDMLASLAASLHRHGRTDSARQVLERLDRPEAPFSARLVWPQARRERVRQGYELAAHLAEARKDWPEARRLWQSAREMVPHRRAAQVEQRAHHLYLAAREIGGDDRLPAEPAARARYVEFQRGLASLRMRDTLTGDALLYRSLASAAASPADALDDWLALARDSEWLDAKRLHSPATLLCLAGNLWSVGRIREARRVYQQARAPSLAPDRWAYCELATRLPLSADDMLKVLDGPAAGMLQPARRFLLSALCQLARTPADCAAAESALEHAGQDGLAESLGRAVRALAEIACGQSAAGPAALWTDDPALAELPERLRLGLEAAAQPQGLPSMRRFAQGFGAGWAEWYPVAPYDVLGWELGRAWARADGAAALEIVESAEAMGLPMPALWRSYAWAACAIQSALQDDFATAERMIEQALAWQRSAQNRQHTDE